MIIMNEMFFHHLDDNYLHSFAFNSTNTVLELPTSIVNDTIFELTQSTTANITFAGAPIPSITLSPSSASISVNGQFSIILLHCLLIKLHYFFESSKYIVYMHKHAQVTQFITFLWTTLTIESCSFNITGPSYKAYSYFLFPPLL